MARQTRRTAGLIFACGALAALALAGAASASVTSLTLAESAYIADPADAGSWRVLLRFEVPNALEGATVDLAILRAQLPIDSQEEREISIEVFPITCAWSAEGTAWDEHWESGDGVWNERRGSISSVTVDEQGELAIDVTYIVDHWLRAEGGARGLVLVPFTAGPAAALAAPPAEIALRVWYTGARRQGLNGIAH